MKKFDLHSFFLKEAGEEDEEDLEQPNQMGPGVSPQDPAQQVPPDPAQMGNQIPQQGEEGSPAEQTQEMSAAETVFADQSGKTIKKIDFKQPSTNSGQIDIYLAEYDIPLTISWSNNKVTVSKPPGGEPIPLT